MLDKIVIKGARVHNLKNIDLEIPRDKFVVVTGISGSGKSSLAFDTIYAEGQRRYVESLSAYARQFLGQMDKPDVDYIGGLSPAIAIDQKTTSKNPRSTVGTVTEIYDYLRLLFARIGTPHCPHCNKEIASQSIDQIVDSVMQFPEGTKLQILAPVLVGKKGENRKVFDDARRAGYARVRVDGVQYDLDDDIPMAKTKAHNVEVIVDRLVMKEDVVARLSGSIETALAQGEGVVIINIIDVAPTNNEEVITNNYCRILQAKFIKFRKNRKKRIRKNSNHSYSLFVIRYSLRGQSCDHIYSTHYACPNCDVSIGELTPRSFSFNSPFGACTECSGIGHLMTVDPALVVRNEKLSLNKGAISVSGWNSHQSDNSIAAMYYNGLAKHYGFSLDTPWEDLPQKIQDILLYGSGNTRVNFKYERNHGKGEYSAKFEGVVNNLQRRYRETNSSWMRMEIEMLMSNNECPSCKGFRLAPVPLAVTIGNKNIIKITNYSIEKAFQFFEKLKLNKKHEVIAAPILKEIKARLGFLTNVGLDYLTLARSAGSLSGGEAQRIRLATQIGSYLQGVLYVLDEPSIGLHQRDNAKLIASLRELCDIGNSLIVVEHDEETMKAADWIIDVGPAAGIHGGEIVCTGKIDDIKKCENSFTGAYLSGKEKIEVPQEYRKGNGNSIKIVGATHNNLKNVNVSIPLGTLSCVTGVSGSGKSSLITEILYKKLANELNGAKRKFGKHKRIEGIEFLDKVIDIDQSPIGRTPRSNPATYTGLFSDIRDIFAQTQKAKMRGYGPSRFSFNVKGGRCEACTGDGILKVEMHFLPDVYVPCEVCRGKRYNRETLEVQYKGKSIAQVLDMTVSEGMEFFENVPKIKRKLAVLESVGLGYIKIGQPSTTLSGGEAQRVKLATELSRRATGKTLYILDEPTTGLHMADVHNLIDVLQQLVDTGNTVVVIEHNLDVIKVSDYIIDLGPDGGDGGGEIIACGTPKQIVKCKDSWTGKYLTSLV